MKTRRTSIATLPFLLIFACCDRIRKVEQKAYAINRYDRAALRLAQANRQLEAEINELKFKIESLEAEKNRFALRLKESSQGGRNSSAKRSVASIAPAKAFKGKDLVRFDIYRWSPEKMIAVAEKAQREKNHTKAAQFYHQFAVHYPEDKRIDDLFLFQAATSMFESGDQNDLALIYFGNIIKNYSRSEFYLGAKLWTALIFLKQGRRGEFFAIAEEFRKKYRNTDEWNVLKRHYEKLVLENRESGSL